MAAYALALKIMYKNLVAYAVTRFVTAKDIPHSSFE